MFPIGVEAIGSTFDVNVWGLVDESQTRSYSNVTDTQTSSFSAINETQTQNYANIDDDQSSSFAEINETQTPNWEEVA